MARGGGSGSSPGAWVTSSRGASFSSRTVLRRARSRGWGRRGSGGGAGRTCCPPRTTCPSSGSGSCCTRWGRSRGRRAVYQGVRRSGTALPGGERGVGRSLSARPGRVRVGEACRFALRAHRFRAIGIPGPGLILAPSVDWGRAPDPGRSGAATPEPVVRPAICAGPADRLRAAGEVTMSESLRIILLLFALVGYAGTGASLAVNRYRRLTEGERDVGMVGVAAMLFIFGMLCTTVGVGLAGVPAVGGVVIWASYTFMAQHMGMFTIETGRGPPTEEQSTRETRPVK